MWQYDVFTTELRRSLTGVLKLKDNLFSIGLMPLEDPSHLSFSAYYRGKWRGTHDAWYSDKDLEVLDIVLSGLPEKTQAAHLGITVSQLKHRTKKLLRLVGHPTVTAYREALWLKYSEEILVSRQQTVPMNFSQIWNWEEFVKHNNVNPERYSRISSAAPPSSQEAKGD